MMAVYYVISALMSSACFYFIKKPSISPTRASGGLSLIFFGVLFLMNHFFQFDYEKMSLLVFGASFVGMCSHKVFTSLEVLLASLIYTSIFVFFQSGDFVLGGTLGLFAFISTFSIKVLFKWWRLGFFN